MISFLNSNIRELFHALPLDKQQAIQSMADELSEKDYDVRVLYVDLEGSESEIAFRLLPREELPVA